MCLRHIEKLRWAEGEKGESRRKDTKRGKWGRGDHRTKMNARLHTRDEKRVLVPGRNGKGDKRSVCLKEHEVNVSSAINGLITRGFASQEDAASRESLCKAQSLCLISPCKLAPSLDFR